MRVLVSSQPGLGHLHPVLPLALAAAAAGHEVRVATGADQVPWVRRCGAGAVPAGLTLRAAGERADTLGFTGPERPSRMFTTVTVPPMTEDLLALVDGERPDVLVHEEGEYAAPLVGALRDVPCVTHSWSSPARPPSGRAILQEPLDEVWDRFGATLPARQTGRLYLDACPPQLQRPDVGDLGAPVVRVHPNGFDGPTEAAPDWLRSVPRPAVYVTLGTVPRFARPELLQRLVDAVSTVAPGVVVSSGPHPADVVRAPHPGVRSVQYLPQSLVLEHVDAVVSHGGAGTTVGALLHGVPSLVVPGIAPSQQLGAERAVAAGVGLRLDWADATPERLREAVTEVLGRADLRAAAEQARADMASLPGPADVLPLLQEVSGSARA